MKNHLFVLITCMALLLSCSFPENNGVSMGAEVNKCIESHIKDLQRLESDFGKTDSYNSRKEAILDYYKSRDDINVKYKNYLDEIYNKVNQKKRNYADYKSQVKFEEAFNSTIDYDLKKSAYIEATKTELPYSILALIRSINPKKPDVSQIQMDLVGHSLSEGVQNGYYPSNWRWVIKEREISDFLIKKVLSDSQKEYMFVAKMRLTSEVGKAFDATVKIRYVLPDDDDWKIDFIQSQGIYIVKTHLYDECVSVIKENWSYYIYNQCDVALEVGGKELNYSGWEKYSHVIPAHSNYRMCCPDDIIIDYVERP